MELLVKTVSDTVYDVVVCGGGTGGVIAALAAARNGAKVALIERKGYVGGIATEGGCGIHSFFNLYAPFEGVEKTKIVRGIPAEFIDKLTAIGGASGHNDTLFGGDYDSDALCVDVEIYKYLVLKMLLEEGVHVMLETMICDAIVEDGIVKGVITATHAGTEAVMGKMFIDSTGYGDFAAHAGAPWTEPNDYTVANSMGIAGIDIDKYYEVLKKYDAFKEYAEGPRSGHKGLIRVDGHWNKLPGDIHQRARALGLHTVTVTTHDDYFMFIKLNYQMEKGATDRDAATLAQFELRRRQEAALELFKEVVPGSEKAFITRTAPMLLIRRARCIECEYDLSNEEIINGTHYYDDVFTYGFHDEAPKFFVKNGGTYGIPYRALQAKNLQNLLCTGMMITSNHDAHMSTRNTVSCMGQGQAAGTAAALCAAKGLSNVRDLAIEDLRAALEKGGVYFEQKPMEYVGK